VCGSSKYIEEFLLCGRLVKKLAEQYLSICMRKRIKNSDKTASRKKKKLLGPKKIGIVSVEIQPIMLKYVK
jgi:hypothetical protein